MSNMEAESGFFNTIHKLGLGFVWKQINITDAGEFERLMYGKFPTQE